MAIEGITAVEETFFHFKESTFLARPTNTTKNTRVQMTYSLSRDVTIIERTVYNTFQLLGDVGGLNGLFLSIGATLVGFWNYYNAENFLIGNLFLSPKSKEKQDSSDQELNPMKQFAFKEYLQESLPKFCLRMGCLKRSKKDKIFLKARNDL